MFAILVSERSAWFDRRTPSMPPIEEAPVVDAGALGRMPIEVDVGLVRFRLLTVHAIASRVRLPAGFRSFLGQISRMTPRSVGGGLTD
jgi:hypothetical protein